MSRKIFYFPLEDESYSKRVIGQRGEKQEMGKRDGKSMDLEKRSQNQIGL
jgi:hypothetical protein